MRKKGYGCPMVLKITFPEDDDSVLLDVLDDHHDHQVKDLQEASGLTEEAKEFIREKAKVRIEPKRIHVLLVVS